MISCARRCALALVVTVPSIPTGALAALPDVETILGKARSKADDFAEQSRMMQARVEEQQSKSRASLKAAKEEYEKKLTVQAEGNSQIEDENKDLQHDISKFLQKNQKLQDESHLLADANAGLRAAMGSMLRKIDVAAKFAKESMDSTDDSGAEELLILAPTTPKPTLDHFLKVAQGGLEAAFLQISPEKKARMYGLQKRPEELVTILSGSLEAISSADKEGGSILKASFLESFKVGQQQKEKLLAEQQALLEQKDFLNVTHVQLGAARDHLKDTYYQLGKRLHGLRLFARNTDGMAATAFRSAQQNISGWAAQESKADDEDDALPANKNQSAPQGKKAIPATVAQPLTPMAGTPRSVVRQAAALASSAFGLNATAKPITKVSNKSNVLVNFANKKPEEKRVQTKLAGKWRSAQAVGKAQPKAKAQLVAAKARLSPKTAPAGKDKLAEKAKQQAKLKGGDKAKLAKVAALPGAAGDTKNLAAKAGASEAKGAAKGGQTPKKGQSLAFVQSQTQSEPPVGAAAAAANRDAQGKTWPVFKFLSWR